MDLCRLCLTEDRVERKPKIGIVAGDVLQPRFLALFEPLKEAFDVCVYALAHQHLMERHDTGLRLRVFDTIPDMPGFMRGLEEELSQLDLIIGIETSRLATFQAVRAARRYGIPMSVVVNEFQPYFYERFVNIRAIQFDICNKSERFWATSHAAECNLRLDSVPSESIGRLAPIINLSRFKPSAAGRKKFREYIGIPESDVVVLLYGELVAHNRPEELIKAMALCRKQMGDKAANLRLLIAGNGPLTMDLKYRSYDLGIGKQTMFLHQDAEPFLIDMYSACDVQMQPRPLPTDHHEEIPLRLLEGMACGLLPLVGAGSVAAEFAGGLGLVYEGDSHLHLAAQLQQLLLSPVAVEAQRSRLVGHMQAHHAHNIIGPKFVREVEDVIRYARSKEGRVLTPMAILAAVEADIKLGTVADALVRIEEALLLDVRLPTIKAELLRLKGDTLYASGQIEAALSAYVEGLRVDERNVRCLRGMGYVSWQGHSNEEALMYFRKALALDDSDGETMLGIGLVFRRLGLNEEAIFWLEKCAVGFNIPAAIVSLAQACAKLSSPELGIVVLKRVIDQIGENHTVMMTLGQLYLSSGQAAEGHAILQKALECA